jgi:hypothetical protein
MDSEEDMEVQSTGLDDLLTLILRAFPVQPLKTFVYLKPVSDLEVLKQRAEHARQDV